MKTNKNSRRNSAFTLIEMVGVLAVIAILAALLVPKIFAAINDSRFSNTVASINSCKTATMDYFGKEAKFPALTSADAANFGAALLAANYMERPLVCKVGTAAKIEIVAGAQNGNGAGGFRLNGTNDTTSAASQVVEVVLESVDLPDAWELSKRIDGANSELTASDATAADSKGRVAYGTGTNGTTTVYVYLAHK